MTCTEARKLVLALARVMVDGASAANDHLLHGVSGHVLSSEAENVPSSAHRMAFHVIWTCLGPAKALLTLLVIKIEKPEAERGNINAKYRVTRETLVQKI
jgi:hypothetical protein